MVIKVAQYYGNLARFVGSTSSGTVSRAYGIPDKGAIAPGYDADPMLVNLLTHRPVLRSQLQTRCQWSPLEGWSLTGWPVITIVGGQIAYAHGKLDTSVRGSALTFAEG